MTVSKALTVSVVVLAVGAVSGIAVADPMNPSYSTSLRDDATGDDKSSGKEGKRRLFLDKEADRRPDERGEQQEPLVYPPVYEEPLKADEFFRYLDVVEGKAGFDRQYFTELWLGDLLGYSAKRRRRMAAYGDPSPSGGQAGVAERFDSEAHDVYVLDDYSRKRRSRFAAHDRPSPLLEDQAKHYSVPTGSSDYRSGQLNLPEQLPVALEPGTEGTFTLPMRAVPPGQGLGLVVQVVVRKTGKPGGLSVAFNRSGLWPIGHPTDQRLSAADPARRHGPQYQAYNYSFPADQIKDGLNRIGVTNTTAEPVTIVGIELAVR